MMVSPEWAGFNTNAGRLTTERIKNRFHEPPCVFSRLHDKYLGGRVSNRPSVR
jgi:hypothetical protein